MGVKPGNTRLSVPVGSLLLLLFSICQKTFKRAGVQHTQNGAVDLVGAGQIVIGSGDDIAVGVLQPVEPGL